MKIAIFGTGYVGLVTGVCFAAMGNEVYCVDINPEKIKKLKSGISPIYEPGLDDMITQNIKESRLFFTTDAKDAIKKAKVVFIAVGTPSDEDGGADLQYVLKVAETIANNIKKYTIIVNKSTVPVGTEYKVTDKISSELRKRNVDISFDVVSNPEFLKEGDAINDCMNPDRIIIGTNSEKASKIMKKLYRPFDPNNNRIMIMDIRSAEMTKYVANAILATKISFMNEMSQISERVNANIDKVRIGIGADRRIGYYFTYPGCGYGGSCFPKDVKALIQTSKNNGYNPRLLHAVHNINQDQKDFLFKKFMTFYNKKIEQKIVAIWGLSFKPNTDDIREAPSNTLIKHLWKNNIKVRLYDPAAMLNFKKEYPSNLYDYKLFSNAYDTLDNAEALFIMTEWQNFKSPDFNEMKQRMKFPLILDGRNIYSPTVMKKLDFHYISIGR